MKLIFPRPVGFALVGALSLATLLLAAGCVTSGWSGTSRQPTPAQVQAVLGRLDNYVYFPSYQVYFNSTKNEYTFWDGRGWVTGRDLPPDLTPELLEAVPSVAMRFDDAPARHHAAVVRTYPRNWGGPEKALASRQ